MVYNRAKRIQIKKSFKEELQKEQLKTHTMIVPVLLKKVKFNTQKLRGEQKNADNTSDYRRYKSS